MKAVQYQGYGGVEVLAYEDAKDPKAKAGEVVVIVHATSVNPIDGKLRSGARKATSPLTFPFIPGHDMSGVIEGTQERVLGFVHHAYAEKVVAPRADLVPIPAGMSDETAASIPLVILTGAQLIETGVQPARGMKLLITGAMGSVGRVAVHVAKQHGVEVIAGVRTSQKAAAASLGASRIVALDDEGELEGLHDLDAVADTVGGKTAEALIPRIRRGGRLMSVVGAPPGTEERGIHVDKVFARPDAARLKELAQDVQNGTLVIPIHRVFSLAEAKEAQAMAEGGGVGKIVIKVRGA